ncbi:3-dehydroquinate synthase [Anabaena sp. FACHB-709]|uniref:3-dehydroquinate synthase n=2 Tax=Nostocaceae TaxID=1162 RepID=A0A1Z4KQZ8_ANAVA|nr:MULTISPECIES: 3-dehydroquinate synthase [Nostocaceae]BAY71382.1 3-dehydroquinate synthase [Trichormus variabilis NIES-23]HBW30143.1 3-dehydroquinate synthase [Nostoc sp. UBA8866]MBD2172067.1 3-dehydroquinate synthase [Anabaena cylindrica FACHB-318]MBD2263742.1 3-dehydroquinate synthase [Anabaena sp. FACHB-709]MBD2274942.1 3-dehydroquinate synthase [Nostoc sp. PCC 7120 = FACHB-418]
MMFDVQRKAQFDVQSISQNFAVSFNYEIYFTDSLFSLKNATLAQVIAFDGERKPKKIIAVVDGGLLEFWPDLLQQITNYAKFYAEVLTLAVEPIVVPGGEAVKNDPLLLNKIHQLVEAAGICRHSYVLGIGGGAVLDLIGYAAATAHRGVRLIRIPTTVLAQNDSGIGVKNGVNAFGKKNFLGTFAPPYAVINDSAFLSTLCDRDWRCGIAEAIKVALIKDVGFFDFIHEHTTALVRRDMDTMQQLIYRCAQLHLEHIAGGDPFEKGSSRPLDFGHWAAHKLEQLTDYNLRHGEAVAIGIALDSTYSYLLGWLTYAEWQQILNTLAGLGFKLYVPELAATSSLFAGLTEFREHLGGELTLTLLQHIGKGVEVHEVNMSLYQQAISLVHQFGKYL